MELLFQSGATAASRHRARFNAPLPATKKTALVSLFQAGALAVNAELCTL